MTLPIAAVERLFDRLSMTYGVEFRNKWAGMPLNEIKTHWAYELVQFADNLTAIGWALQNLPDRCPNLIEFKNLCKQAPRPVTVALDAPKAPVEVIDREISKMLAGLIKKPTDAGDHKRWASSLKERHEKGEHLSPYQINCYKTALDMLS
jgi:hypothetical protein